jgi:hypothetical protein
VHILGRAEHAGFVGLLSLGPEITAKGFLMAAGQLVIPFTKAQER